MDEQSGVAPDSASIPSEATTCVVTQHRVDQVIVVSVSGVVDMLTAPQLETAITAALAEKPAGVVVDFTDVEFLASVGMGVLVAAHDEAGDDIRFSVVADGPATSRPLKLIGIADILPLFPTLDEALTAQRA
ncbi:STAS domain-containing protein [Mycobacterium sp. URHB0021]